MTVVHTVLFKLKDPAKAEPTASRLRAMSGQIEVLEDLEVGVDVLRTPRSYDLALTARFSSWDDLETYRTHPVHQPVLAHMAEVAESAVVVDYEA